MAKENPEIHYEIIKTYWKYNATYQKCIDGYKEAMRGIMHYKKTKDGRYNTSLFGKELDIIDEEYIQEKQREMKGAIIELRSLKEKLEQDNMMKDYTGVCNFLGRNIDTSVLLLEMLGQSTIYIEAQKVGYTVSPDDIQKYITHSNTIQEKLMGPSISQNPNQKSLILKYLAHLIQKNPDTDCYQLKHWLAEETKDMNYSKRSKNLGLLTASDDELHTYSPEQSLSTLVLAIQAQLEINNSTQEVLLVISENMQEKLDIDKIKQYLPRVQINYTPDATGEYYNFNISKKSWRMIKNNFFAPGNALGCTLDFLGTIIDHEFSHDHSTRNNNRYLRINSHGYRRLEEGIATMNERLVTAKTLQDLKKKPSYHHVACMFGEYFGFEELSGIMTEYFVLSGEKKAKATTLGRQAAFKVKRYYPLESTGANRFLLEYTNGYYDLLDLYKKSQLQGSPEIFENLWKQQHYGKLTKKDLKDMMPFIKAIEKQTTAPAIPDPVYIGRIIHQHIIYGTDIDLIIEKDPRHTNQNKPTKNTLAIVRTLIDNIKKILKAA